MKHEFVLEIIKKKLITHKYYNINITKSNEQSMLFQVDPDEDTKNMYFENPDQIYNNFINKSGIKHTYQYNVSFSIKDEYKSKIFFFFNIYKYNGY
jgi:hypothetical protein